MQAPPPAALGALGPRPNPYAASSTFALYLAGFAMFLTLFSRTSIHQIPEGHVGVYWRGGKLLQRVTGPGIHMRVPLLDVFEAIQVTMQTDKVVDIPCGTKGGVIIQFEKVEVVNRLQRKLVYETIRDYGVHYDRTWIYDKVFHEMNQFCSSHSLQEVYIDKFDQVDEKLKEALQQDCNRYAPGIEIINVRVTKPSIPDVIRANYVAMEVERTKVLVAVERQKVIEREVEAERTRAIAEAEKLAQTSRIHMEQLLAERSASLQQENISNQIYLARQRALADADFYRLEREAEAHKLKLTPEFLEYTFIQAIANNTKVFFGEKLPTMVVGQRLLEGVFDSRDRHGEEHDPAHRPKRQ